MARDYSAQTRTLEALRRDPDFRRKQAAASRATMKRLWKNPEFRERSRRVAAENGRNRRKPIASGTVNAHGVTVVEYLGTLPLGGRRYSAVLARCPECDGEWQLWAQNFPRTKSCKSCAGRRFPASLRRENGLKSSVYLKNYRTGRHQIEASMAASARKGDTKPELAVKDMLDDLGIVYEHPFDVNGRFLVDFYLPAYNAVIEVDGCYWHKCRECGYGDGRGRDRSRNAYLRACGYLLMVIKEHDLT